MDKSENFPFVSVITPTYNRHEHIPLVVYMFNTQDYPQNYMELVIFDDSPTQYKGQCIQQSNIRYIHEQQRYSIPQKRNRLNDEAQGKYIVCFDDDDYYPPQRVSHAISSLQESGKELAGCTKILLAHTYTEVVISVGPFHNNHATNNTFAYTKSLSQRNRYNDNDFKNISEERIFTNNFKEPMAQLDPQKTIICLQNGTNSVDKNIFFKKGKKQGKIQNYILDKYVLHEFQKRHSKKDNPKVVASISIDNENQVQNLQKTIESLCNQTYENLQDIIVSVPNHIQTPIVKQKDKRIRVKYCENLGPSLKYITFFEKYNTADVWCFFVEPGFIYPQNHIQSMVEESQKRFYSKDAIYGLSGANCGRELPPREEKEVEFLHSACGIFLHRQVLTVSSRLYNQLYNTIFSSQDYWLCPEIILAQYIHVPKIVVVPHHTLNLQTFWIHQDYNVPQKSVNSIDTTLKYMKRT